MTSSRAPVVELLLAAIDEAFERKAWHGTNLRGALRGLSARQAAWRPAPGRHNVWEIALHAAYWKYAVRRRLSGEKRGRFSLAGSNWFVRPADNAQDEPAWRRDLALLTREHRRLREVVAALRDPDLERTAGRWRLLALVRGIAFHDVYHAGQIQSLKRLQQAKVSDAPKRPERASKPRARRLRSDGRGRSSGRRRAT